MNPLISIVMPVGTKATSGSTDKYLMIMLNTLKYQRGHRYPFEVVVSIDGVGKSAIEKKIKKLHLPYRCITIETPRLSNKHLPHRNHARNTGIEAATGSYIWMVDADQVVESNMMSCIEKAIEMQRKPTVFFTPIFSVNQSPQEWLKDYTLWDGENYDKFFKKIPKKGGGFSYFSEYYKRSNHLTMPLKTQKGKSFHLENFPIFRKELFYALKGFDESFLGWGGNKHEFCMRINQLAQKKIIRLEVITQARVLHQAHPKDVTKHQRKLRAKNSNKFMQKKRGMHKNEAWWVRQVRDVRKAILQWNSNSPPICEPRENGVSFIQSAQFYTPTHCANSGEAPPQNQFIFVGEVPPQEGSITIETHLRGEKALHLGATASSGAYLVFIRGDVSEADVEGVLKGLHSEPCVYGKNILGVWRSTYFREGGLVGIHSSDAFKWFARQVNGKPITSGDVWKPKGLLDYPFPCGKPKVSIGMITYNRVGLLKKCLGSLLKSLRPDRFDYEIVVSDDGSDDGTLAYLAGVKYPIKVLKNKRGGVAAQSNRILKYFDGKVEYGFLCNDDLLFKPGWEELYIHAMMNTPYSHFVFMDKALEERIQYKLFPPKDLKRYPGGILVNWADKRIQGALVTFDQRVIDKVGGMDALGFKRFGHEHVDWTVRNKRAKLAPGDARWVYGCYDVLGSNEFVTLNLKNYKRSVKDSEIASAGGHRGTEGYFNTVEADARRIYLPLITDN